MGLPRRKFLHLAATAATLPAVSSFARVESYPARPVRIIVGFQAGTASDIIARLIGQWFSDRLGQQFVASLSIGTATSDRAPATFAAKLGTGSAALSALWNTFLVRMT